MDEQPIRIRISPADPELQAHIDAAMFQPSMLPGQYPELLGEQQPLWEGGCDKTPRSRRKRPREDQPGLFG